MCRLGIWENNMYVYRASSKPHLSWVPKLRNDEHEVPDQYQEQGFWLRQLLQVHHSTQTTPWSENVLFDYKKWGEQE